MSHPNIRCSSAPTHIDRLIALQRLFFTPDVPCCNIFGIHIAPLLHTRGGAQCRHFRLAPDTIPRYVQSSCSASRLHHAGIPKLLKVMSVSNDTGEAEGGTVCYAAIRNDTYCQIHGEPGVFCRCAISNKSVHGQNGQCSDSGTLLKPASRGIRVGSGHGQSLQRKFLGIIVEFYYGWSRLPSRCPYQQVTETLARLDRGDERQLAADLVRYSGGTRPHSRD